MKDTIRSAVLCIFLAFYARLVSSFLLPQNANNYANAIQRRHTFVATEKHTHHHGMKMIPNDFNIDHFESQDGDDPRQVEFDISSDEPLSSNIRVNRFQNERENKEKFVPYGNELWDLKSELISVSKQLVDKMAGNEDRKVIQDIRNRIRSLEQRDANIVYGMELDAMDKALDEGREDDAEEHKRKALNARDQLVQFQYEGVWVGKYGDHGFELVNITYIGDTLIARKITGDKNVPSGEITFQADLSPPRHSNKLPNQKKSLSNIILSEGAAKRWGTKELQRFEGLGQVAEEGFINSQWLEGQIVLINEGHFSFAWLPISHQIFFGRPSPELQLKLLRENEEKKVLNNADAEKDFLIRCFDVTKYALEDGLMEDNSESCIFAEDDVCCFE